MVSTAIECNRLRLVTGDVVATLLTLAVLLVCCIVPASVIANVTALLSGMIYAAFLALQKPDSVFKYLAFWFMVIANVVGCAVCEFTVDWLPELATNAHFVGSLPLLVLAHFLFVVSILLYDSLRGVRVVSADSLRASGKKATTILRLAAVVVAGLAVSIFAAVFDNPSFVLGYDRFKYAAEYGIPWVSTLAGWLSFLLVIPVLLLRKQQNKLDILIGAIAVGCYVLYRVWVGDKFGSFFSLICVFSLVYYDAILRLNATKLRFLIIAAIVGFAILLGFTVFAHSFTSSAGVQRFLSERVAQQGQLWWRTYDLCDGEFHPSEFSREIDATLRSNSGADNNVSSRNGIYGIMYYTTPGGIVDEKLGRGSRYTEAGYACAYYYFGPAGVIVFAITVGLLVAAMQNAILRSLWCGWLLESAVWLRFSFLLQTAISMFTFNVFFTRLSIVCFFFLIACAFARRVFFDKAAHGGEFVVGATADASSNVRAS